MDKLTDGYIDSLENKIGTQKAEIDELEKLLLDAMHLIPPSKPVLKTPTAVLNWRAKAVNVMKRREQRGN